MGPKFPSKFFEIYLRQPAAMTFARIAPTLPPTKTKGPNMSNPNNSKAERLTMPAVLKGWKRKCPQCGSGPLLSGYLTVNDTCTVCSEELHHHRADDGPAYLTILLVGHLMAPLLHMIFVRYRPEPLVLFTIFSVGCVGLSLYLLPRLKGAMIGFQWARLMHGFR